MENYSYTSYPESGDSSPRSREIDFENPPPWEENSSNNYKVKFMCSYGGKIHPRPHDNQLSYVGGETKILAAERTIKFSGLVAKLSALCEADVCFKYQLPGEDLDALISVTNDDDLEHMMHEYDRLNRASPKPARLRLFLFPATGPSPALTPAQSFGSNASEGKSERERFVEALNSGPVQSSTPPSTAAPPNNVDFLFGLEKGMPPPVVAKVHDPIPDPAVHHPEVMVPGMDDRMVGSDPIQKHIQDLQRLRIAEEQQAMYRRKSDDNLAGGYTGDYYVQQKTTEKVSPATLPGTVPGPVPVSAGYWPEKQVGGGVYPAASTMGADQQVYMIQAPSSMYHAPMARPVTGPIGRGYYEVQRMPTEVYREQPVYNFLPPQAQSAATQPTVPQQLPPKMAAYSEGIRMVQPPNNGGVGVTETGYTQVAYDSAIGRQVYYTAQGAVVAQPSPQLPPPTAAQYQAAMAAATTYSQDMRPAGAFNQESGNVVPAKVSQATM